MIRSRRRVSGSRVSRSASTGAPGGDGGDVARRVDEVAVADRRAVARAEGAERGAAQAEVVGAAPVAEVVARLVAGARVVGDLVVDEALGLERLLDGEEGVGHGVVGRDGQPPAPGQLAELGARLDGQAVRGEVGDAGARDLPHLGGRLGGGHGGSGRRGDAVDEVGADAGDAGAEGGVDGGEPALGIVEAAEEGEALGVEALHADAEPAHPLGVERAGAGLVERGGVALDGDLHVVRALVRRGEDGAEHPPELRRLPQRGGAAAEEDRPSRLPASAGRRRSSSAITASA